MILKKIKFSLKTQLIIGVMLLMIFVISVITCYVINHEKNLITLKTQSSGLLLARTLSNTLKNSLIENDYVGTKVYLQDIKKDKDSDVAAVYVLEDINRTCIAHINNMGRENFEGLPYSLFTDEISIKLMNSKKEIVEIWTDRSTKIRYIDICCPIYEGNTLYGKIRLIAFI